MVVVSLPVLEDTDFQLRSSSMWPHEDHLLDEDSSGLDYMLALSLQSDAESGAGGGDSSLWSSIWDHKTLNTSDSSPLSPPNNNYTNFNRGVCPGAAQDRDQTGEGNTGENVDLEMTVLIISLCSYRDHASL